MSFLKSHVCSRDKLPLVDGLGLLQDGPLQNKFDVIEELMLDFCERVALPYFLARDANPNLYDYLSYLKTQVEAKPCEQDFDCFRVMGKGGFGLVKGCRTLRTGKMWGGASRSRCRRDVAPRWRRRDEFAPRRRAPYR